MLVCVEGRMANKPYPFWSLPAILMLQVWFSSRLREVVDATLPRLSQTQRIYDVLPLPYSGIELTEPQQNKVRPTVDLARACARSSVASS